MTVSRSDSRMSLGLFSNRPGSGPSGWMPPALYALFAFALVALAQPRLIEGLERRMMQWASMPIRAFVGREVAAADPQDLREQALAEAWVDRQQSRARFLVPDAGPMKEAARKRGLRPVIARVLDRRGGDAENRPQELILELKASDLPERERFVTRGNVLLGFVADSPVARLDRAGRPDPLADHLRISLLHRNDETEPVRCVPVATKVGGRDLVFLVEPALRSSRYPLHCTLFSDLQLASDVVDDTYRVETTLFEDDPEGPLPVGLAVGRLRVYGYQARRAGKDDRQVVPIDYFVEPELDSSVVSHVVLWTDVGSSIPRMGRPRDGLEEIPVALLRFTVASAGGHRFLASTRAGRRRRLPLGAAVVRGERLLGFVDAAGVDFGVVAPLGEPGRELSLVILPNVAGKPPVALRAVCLGREGNLVRLSSLSAGEIPPGQAFTGTDGLDAPAGLWIGSVVRRNSSQFEIQHVDPRTISERAVVLSRVRDEEGLVR